MAEDRNTLSESSGRIARNTLLLYFRMILLLVIGLYTSRVILQTLGTDDVGIYNVVGGVVTMFAFLNSAMVGVSQRYITFSLGKGDPEASRKVFSTVMAMHIAIAAIVLVVGEAGGLWLLNHRMVIPPDRAGAAFWVFQSSMLSLLFMMVSVPYNGAIIAHEKMEAFAYISLFDAGAKLAIAFLIGFMKSDRLIIYAILLLAVQVIDRIVYGIYCRKHFEECRLGAKVDRNLFREMLGFGGWNMFGSLASVGMTQGVNVLLNIFFGPAVNAARSFAVQIESCVTGFVSNFQTAINPQIIKNYASDSKERMHSLVFSSGRYSFYLLLMIALPLILKADYVVTLWLKTPPEHTASFIRIIMLTALVNTMSGAVNIASQATGDVRKVQVTVGSVLLSIVPVAYLALKLGAPAEAVFITCLLITAAAQLIRLWIVCPMIGMRKRDYFRNVYLPVAKVAAPAAIAGTLIHAALPKDDFATLAATVAICIAVTAACIYFLGIGKAEKEFLKDRLSSILGKKR
ncbi:MAG: lipopolysaccharide biosynthesis protein [Bacteroidales bacterium]|nr:lipopolysaccharide biosynthesis protein [Bacteroidales bacterium]